MFASKSIAARSLLRATRSTSPCGVSRFFKTSCNDRHRQQQQQQQRRRPNRPGSLAFADCETDALRDLYFEFARYDCENPQKPYLTVKEVRELLSSIGEHPNEKTIQRIFQEADLTQDGKLDLIEFLNGADKVLGGSPARIVLVVGGPGSGKGILCQRLRNQCGIVHLSSGDMLREEVTLGTPLGKEVAQIMERGELVSSAVITTLVRRRMRNHPGARVLLDGFPRSLDNAHDLMKLCGKPELALHLQCDDTVMLERILHRATTENRSDDNIQTALQRLRTFHKSHKPTMDWLREQQVPIVNLDCSGTPENVWNQLLAIGRLMRPAAQHSNYQEEEEGYEEVNHHGFQNESAIDESEAVNSAPQNDDISFLASNK